MQPAVTASAPASRISDSHGKKSTRSGMDDSILAAGQEMGRRGYGVKSRALSAKLTQTLANQWLPQNHPTINHTAQIQGLLPTRACIREVKMINLNSLPITKIVFLGLL